MNRIWKTHVILGLLAAALSCSGQATNELRDAVVLIIRHAEKPESGKELTVEGEARAQAYVKYFGEFQLDGKPLKLDSLFAAHDSKNSNRPRLTLEPLAQALKLPLDSSFKDKEPEKLAAELQTKPHGKNILVCWHHGGIPGLARALGADPATLLPGGAWPDNVYGWVIELRYDGEGRLIPGECKRINEHLMPKDVE
ncbi:MAG: flagellar basal body-associated protein FliL [Verrucomicrobiota bacterium]|jgi:broad specificity phosphatase PhoE